MGERVVAGKTEQHPERPRGDLRIQPTSRGVRGRRNRQLLAPERRSGVDLNQRERDRAIDLAGQPLHPREFSLRGQNVFARNAFRRELEHRLSAGSHRPTEAEQFVFRGESPRNRLAVHRAVSQGSRRRKAQRPGLNGLAHQARHRIDVLGVGGLVARTALAHRVGADGSVRDLTAHVDGELSPPDHIEVLGVAFPAPRNAFRERGARNVFHTFHQLDQPVLAPGPDGGESHPAVAGDHGGDAVAAGRLELAVPADLPVVVGVDVDESRCDDTASGVDGFARLPRQARICRGPSHHFDDLAIPDPDVGEIPGHAGAVDYRATDKFQVEHAVTSPARSTIDNFLKLCIFVIQGVQGHCPPPTAVSG